ncbi:MAG: helix-turn-helix domain-containing protein [bacterium]|nr:helix-turn-helix domain-containing protein [bacterium]
MTVTTKSIIIKSDNNTKNENNKRSEADSLMKKDITKIIMNPIRQRILQFLMIHTTGTAGEMKVELNDIPPASLYRHIKVLAEAGLIEVVEEKKIRGTMEKTYGLKKQPMGEVTEQDVGSIIQTGLFSLMSSFGQYFSKEGNDPVKDMLNFSTSTLMLSDEEYMQFLMKIGEAINGVIKNQPQEGRKPRRFTIISSPCEEEDRK